MSIQMNQMNFSFGSISRVKRLFLLVAGLTSSWLLLAISQITTSHIAIFSGGSGEVARTILGSPRGIRSDEFLRNSPLSLSGLNSNVVDHWTPFELAHSAQFQTGWLTSLLRLLSRPEALATRLFDVVLPTSSEFALRWWAPTFVGLVGFSLLFDALGLRMRDGLLSGLVLFFVPLNQWFSYLPFLLAGSAACGFALTFLALRNVGDIQNLTRKSLFFRVATSSLFLWWSASFLWTVVRYPPWGFPLLLFFGALCAEPLFREFVGLKHFSRVVIGAGVVLGALLLLVLEVSRERQLIEAVLNTVYPGQRRTEEGVLGSVPYLGGASSWMMQFSEERAPNSITPEYAFAPVAFVLVAVSYLVRSRGGAGESVANRDGPEAPDGQRVISRGLMGCLIVCAIVGLWSLIEVPNSFRWMNPMTLIPKLRGLQILGYLCVLVACVATAALRVTRLRRQFVSHQVTVALGVVGLLWVASDTDALRRDFYLEPRRWITIASLIALGVVMAFMMNVGKKASLAFVMACFYFGGSSFMINPVLIGLGPLQNSLAADTIRFNSESDPDGRWATSGFYEDALVLATGVAQLTGQQHGAPNYESWRIVDPDLTFENSWNRGQAYVNLQFDAGAQFTVWNPSPDVIQIVANPCDNRFRDLGLKFYFSPRVVSSSCLPLVETVEWMGIPTHIYQYLPNAL